MKLSEIKDKLDDKINLLFHDGTDDIHNDIDGVILIDPSITLATSDAINDDMWRSLKHDEGFMHKFRLVFGDLGLPDHSLKQHGTGVRHIVGLIVATDLVMQIGKSPFWKMPESYLHPKYQLGLGDLIVYYYNEQEKRRVAQAT